MGKMYYACVSATIWGSIFGSVMTGSIPIGMILRQARATASPTLKEAVIRYIKNNNFLKEVKINKDIVIIDKEWYEQNKNNDVIILECPERSISNFLGKNIPNPYQKRGGLFNKGKNILSDIPILKNAIKKVELNLLILH